MSGGVWDGVVAREISGRAHASREFLSVSSVYRRLDLWGSFVSRGRCGGWECLLLCLYV